MRIAARVDRGDMTFSPIPQRRSASAEDIKRYLRITETTEGSLGHASRPLTGTKQPKPKGRPVRENTNEN